METWYEKNKKFVASLKHNIQETRLSESLEGLFQLKPVEDCITMLVSDVMRLKEKNDELEKTIMELKK